MLKKSLLAVIVLALVASVAVADIPEQDTGNVKKTVDKKLKLKAGGWPAEFAYVNLEGFKIPVYMHVKLYMEILNMQSVIEAGIILDNQISMSKYSGCSIPIKIKSNFDLELEGKFSFTEAGDELKGKKDKLEIRMPGPADDPCGGEKKPTVDATLCKSTAQRVVYLRLKEIKLVHVPFKKKLYIGNVQLRVRPNYSYQWVDP